MYNPRNDAETKIQPQQIVLNDGTECCVTCTEEVSEHQRIRCYVCQFRFHALCKKEPLRGKGFYQNQWNVGMQQNWITLHETHLYILWNVEPFGIYHLKHFDLKRKSITNRKTQVHHKIHWLVINLEDSSFKTNQQKKLC